MTLFIGDPFVEVCELCFVGLSNCLQWIYLCRFVGCKFKVHKTHNMHALMLDPRFKGLKCVTKLVGVVPTCEFVEEYDNCVILPLSVLVN
jgi:hypothetical protein